MRKNRLSAMAGAIALLLASCSADEPVAQNTTENAINYTVVAANQARALNSYCNNKKPDSFQVWAIKNDGTNGTNGTKYFTKSHTIQKDNDSNYTDQTDDDEKNWPTDGSSLSFYAVADLTASNTGTTTINEGADENKETTPTFEITTENNTVQVKNYTIKTEVAQQLDLMYAVAKDVENGNLVHLNFRHALSQICFRARNEIENTTVKIQSISVKGVYDKGDYTFGKPTTPNYEQHYNSSSNAISSETITGEWELDRTKNPTEYTVTLGTTTDGGTKEGIEVLNKDTDLTCGVDDGNGVYNWNKALNLLPQEKDITFELNFKINGVDSKNYTSPASVNVHVDWEQGYRYIYTFIFTESLITPSTANAIEYKVTVDDFKTNVPEDDYIIDDNGHIAVLMRKATESKEALYFATTNIDANTPYESGKYFWWGDIQGYEKGQENFSFDENNSSIKTHNKTLEQLKENKWIEEDTNVLTKEHDAAYINWGDLWRMPTYEDFEWLTDNNNCTWEWFKKNDAVGYKVTSNTTGNIIFLPAAGYINGTAHYTLLKQGHANSPDEYLGFYWSASPKGLQPYENTTGNAARLRFKKGYEISLWGGNRWDGFPIRPVVNIEKLDTNTGTNTQIPVTP